MIYVHHSLKFVAFIATISLGKCQSICGTPGTDGRPVCCPYYFPKSNSCKECPPGSSSIFNDVNCSSPCGYPSFGARCGGVCNCSEKDCHHITGCPGTSTIYISTEGSFGMTRLITDEERNTTNKSSNQDISVETIDRLTVRGYVLGIGLVLVAIMVVINIFNIHTYRKRNIQDKETMHPAI